MVLLASKVDEAVTGGKAGVLERLLLDAVPVETVMDAMVGGSDDRLLDGVVDDGLVDGVVNNWCGLRHWDHTAAHLAGKLHRDLPAVGRTKLG